MSRPSRGTHAIAICRRLEELVARAWHALAELGAQPHEVLDWLRDESGVEDVPALKRAVYGAAADWLRGGRPNRDWNLTPLSIETAIRTGDVHFLPRLFPAVSDMRRWAEEVHKSEAAPWLAWCDRADAAIDLCRRLEELPE